VTSTGATYNGPYNSSIYSTTTFRIGPGVAPKADLYAIRVFGCEGSTDVVVDALNWAVANRMDVVNMSLGSAYGNPTDPDVEATNNAEDAGIIVVASAGNSGPAPYITGSPGIAEKAISVAAADSIATFPGFNLTLNPGSVGITAMNANDGNPPAKNPLSVYVIPPPAGKTYSGCSESEYVDALIKGKLLVTVRGLCPRVDRAIFGARHGAAAVAMINNSSLNPVYEGPIAGVDIPFLGIQKADGAKLKAATSVLFGAATTLSNSGYTGYASFTSGGPRRGDSMLKPDVTGPGVSILSTLVGSGDKSVRMSGTSMAAPHVAGVAALVRQAHPDWDTADQRAAIVNTPTVSPNKVSDYQVSRGGSGLVQASSAVHTQVTATGEDGATALSFGFNELTHDYKRVMQFQVVNHGNSPATFIASAVKDGSAQPHTVTVSPSSVTVGAGDSTDIKVTLSVKAADVGSAIGSPDDPNNTFWQASGAIRLTPAPGTNSGVSLRVPYFMVPRARSSVETKVSGDFGDSPTATATVTNAKGARSGVADFYAWGLEGSNKKLGEIGIRAVGAQTDPASGTLTFGVNTFGRFDTPNVSEFDILIDTTGTGKPNWVLYAMDLGNAMSGSYDGNYMSILCAIPCKKVKVEGVATAPFNGNTILMPVAISHLGLTAANPRFSYSVMSFDVRGDLGYASDSVAGAAWFNAFTPAITTGQPSYTVAPGATATTTISINQAELDRTPALGLMVVTADNRSGAAQAQLIPIRQNQ
jgi:subtilisin family serine protease